jgi:RNA polymerase primary sigma factor
MKKKKQIKSAKPVSRKKTAASKKKKTVLKKKPASEKKGTSKKKPLSKQKSVRKAASRSKRKKHVSLKARKNARPKKNTAPKSTPKKNTAVKKSPKSAPKTKIQKVKKEHLEKERDDRAKELTPMRIYLNQIEHIPLLTPAEELSLSELIQEKKRTWKEARKKMIRSNLRLVINIAKRYMNIGLPFSDLVEEGNIGLMRAVDKFNYKKGYRFSTYASWWIKQSIMRALSNQGKLIRIPVHMFETMNRWRKVREYLIQKDGKIPSHKEIATIMKIKPEKVKEIEQVASTSPSSLNAPVSLDGEAELIDLIEDDLLKMPHEGAHQISKDERIEELLNFLNDRERKILVMRFGLYHTDTHTLEETAQQFDITRERVRQIEEAALKKIRCQLTLQNDRLENYL